MKRILMAGAALTVLAGPARAEFKQTARFGDWSTVEGQEFHVPGGGGQRVCGIDTNDGSRALNVSFFSTPSGVAVTMQNRQWTVPVGYSVRMHVTLDGVRWSGDTIRSSAITRSVVLRVGKTPEETRRFLASLGSASLIRVTFADGEDYVFTPRGIHAAVNEMHACIGRLPRR
jgi:hypothetical protein